MDLTTIVTPLIGSGIGYVTNYIAVKMLFRPLKPVKIGNFQLPFTPGIIPKEKDRLAKGISDIVGERLVTKEAIEQMLLSQEVKVALQRKISSFLDSDTTLESFLNQHLSNEKVEELKTNITDNTSSHIAETLKEADLGTMLSNEIIQSIKDYLKGGFLAMMLNDSILLPIGEQIANRINDFVEKNGENLIKPHVEKEVEHIIEYTPSDLKSLLTQYEISLEDIIYEIYEKAVCENLNDILSLINVQKMAEEQIQKMDVLELEELILTVMKKELNAIVNLGALIGLILGMINLLI